MTPNFCKTYFDMQDVEILEEKEEKPIEPIVIVEDQHELW